MSNLSLLKRLFTGTLSSILIVGLVGCALYAPESRQPNPMDVPTELALYESSENISEDVWWKTFEADDLNLLLMRAFESNLSIQEAYARLDQARASALKTGAVFVPEIDVTAGYGVTRQKIEMDSPMDGVSTTRKTSVGLSIPSYEVDLWGRVRSVHEAAQRDFQASAEDIRAAHLSVASEISIRWLEWIYQHEALSVLDQQLEGNRQSLEIIETRFRFGMATALDIYQQKQVVASVEALRPAIEGRIRELHNELAVLAGLPVGSDLNLVVRPLPKPLVIPNPGLPADVLASRPDVRRAGLTLEAADWRVAAARADRLPAIRLTGALTYSAEEMKNLFDNWMANLAAGLVGPIFDAGRRQYEVDRARAVAEERLAGYRATVFNAVREVQNALIRFESQKSTLEAQLRQLEIARDGTREAMTRYLNGKVEYLSVLTSLTQSQQLERSVLQSHYQHLLNYISIQRALGGKWMDQLEQIETK